MKTLWISMGTLVASSICPFPYLAMAVMSNSDCELIESIYFQYRSLMYCVARKYFSDNPNELEDVIEIVLERMCRYVSKIREVPSNKIQAYVVLIVENVCRTRLQKIIIERDMHIVQYDDTILSESGEHITDSLETVFDYADTRVLLASFKGLSQRDQDIDHREDPFLLRLHR